MNKIPFVKMHGQGNDYLFIRETDISFENPDYPDLARQMSDRHFGVGSDGIVVLSPSENADFKMRIWNADGSEAEMCGTALRCSVFFMSMLLDKMQLTVETLSGIKSGSVDEDNSVTVSLGIPRLIESSPINLQVNDIAISGFAVNMGNPHFVIFDRHFPETDEMQLGSLIEKMPQFPHKTNVEFVKKIDNSALDVNVWERGSGKTLACGTGAGASAYIGHRFFDCTDQLQVRLPGGEVMLNIIQNEVFLKGSVSVVFDGVFFVF